MTTADATRELRIMAASLVVDNGNYGKRLLAIADWIERKLARMYANQARTQLEFQRELMKLKQTYPALETDEHFQRIEQLMKGE